MISLVLMIITGALNAAMDILFTAYSSSIFSKFNPSWWDPQQSWKWKWATPLQPPDPKWYYFGFLPRYKERFIYSSTIFVWVTDAWHFIKALMILAIVCSIVLYTPIIAASVDWLIYYIAWTFTFTIFFDYIYRK
jgi:hypothetical protein